MCEHLEDDRAKEKNAQSRLGEKARIIDLDRDNVGEFMLFSAGSPPGISQVLHLHGSVEKPGNMIITDIDYNRRYFAKDAWTDLLEDSQELLYRSNAIVFVGVGMTEDMLFRAMRILSQAPHRDARPIYAFMETHGEAKDTADAIKLFQRYGIRTIFYGTRLGERIDPETGDFHDHPLIEDYCKYSGNKDACAEIAKRLRHLPYELAFIEALKERIDKCLEAIRAGIGSDEGKDVHGKAVEEFIRVMKEGHDTKDPFLKEENVDQLPRLHLTPWHGDVYRLIRTITVSSNPRQALWADANRLGAIREAIDFLGTAIHSRALQDALRVIAAKSTRWRKRWQATPRGVKEDISRGFRCEQHAQPKHGILAHNISGFPSRKKRDRLLLGELLLDTDGDDVLKSAKAAMTKHALVVGRSRNGSGKGVLAYRLASENEKENERENGPIGWRRMVMTFGQSCGRDAIFDLMADSLRKLGPPAQWTEEKVEDHSIELILSKCDLVMMPAEKRPRIAEWEVVLRRAIEHPGVRILALCDGLETRDFFCDGTSDTSDLWEQAPEIFRNKSGIQQSSWGVAGHVDFLKDILAIAKDCRSVWVAAFLASACSVVVYQFRRNVVTDIGETTFSGLLDHVKDVIRKVQDPRQRVPAVIDAVIACLEHYVVEHLGIGARVVKVISHSILKHMLAFGGPVEGDVLRACPELVGIAEDYLDNETDRAAYIRLALKWLTRFGLIVKLEQCYRTPTQESDVRYGLHGHVRNWLSTKRGMPFAVVMGREQTAITVVPIIDEEMVPLDRSDYEFVWKAVDALLAPNQKGEVRSSHIRAAFMLIRGSTRIGTVLRSPHGGVQTPANAWTSLENYLRRLLAIRQAALEFWGQTIDSENELPPLFEREWIWLFNELGVVKLLQGHALDAVALFEQAIEFESRRLKMKRGFETLVYSNYRFPEFSITKLRIMMNLAMAEIERGSFNRAKRILSSEKRDLNEVEHLFLEQHQDQEETWTVSRQKDAEPASVQGSQADQVRPSRIQVKRPRRRERKLHREIRLLRLVQGLAEARLKFLSGGSGEALQWLKRAEQDIIAEGVHGMTSIYYQYLGDVHKRSKNMPAAQECFSLARAEAEASGRSDLVFSVMLAESECAIGGPQSRDTFDLQQQLTKIRKIKHEARRMGMTRIVVTASMIRARLYLSFGEYRSARQDLMTALTLSTANGLNIKRISALIDMAALVGSLDAQLRGEAKDIAEAARFEAERMGYKLAAARAKDLELVLREQGSIEEWVLRQDRGVSAGRGDAD